jgi:hemerythrin
MRETRALLDQQTAGPESQSEALLRYLKTWWLMHIRIMDQAYAPYLGKELKANKPDEGDA